MAQASNHLTFKQFITEGRDAPLYHATNWPVGIAILSSNELQPKTQHEQTLIRGAANISNGKVVWGMSLTRELDYAREWVRGLIFEFDQAKLTHRYPLYPINFYRNRQYSSNEHKRTEYEEFLVFKKPIPLNPYLRKVYINKTSYQKTMEDVKYKWGSEDQKMVDACQKLVFDNPKFGGLI